MSRLDRVLVTGGAGFIGSHIVDRLVNADYEVTVFDNLSTGRLQNIEHHLAVKTVSFIEGDVRDVNAVERSVEDVDVVIHLAALSSVPFSFRKPFLTREVNVDGTANLLNTSLKANVARFIYISSCSVYGDAEYLPIDEKHPANPISPYAESKLEAEHQCRALAKDNHLATTVLRPFNVYGRRQAATEYSGVITKFLEKIESGLPLIIYGDGSQTRDFVHVTDVADAVLKTLGNGKCTGETCNVAFGKPTSINELASTVLEVSGVDLGIIHEDARPGDVKNSFADISKAREILGYQPKVDLREGLLKTLPFQ